MSSNFLITPIHLEALHIKDKSSYLAVEPMANFRHLPYCDRDYDSNPQLRYKPEASGRDFLSGTPYISENIVSQPFQNRNLLLSPGIHLHWELPQALRTGEHKEAGEHKEESLSFPTAPNCWLVMRKRGETIEHSWIVESDYLWPPETEKIENTPTSVCIPYPPNPEQGKYQPFRYLGRQLSLKDWLNNNRKDHEYWGKFLTAIGYGEPAFAAFYPNCYSVFGCHDTEPGDLNSNLSYEVIGWHSEIGFDYIRSLISDYSPESEGSLAEFIQDKTDWKFKENLDPFQSQLRTLYYGRLEFQPNSSEEAQPELDSVILANSGTEALSTYIANRVNGDDDNLSKLDIENQLEAIQLLSSLEGEKEDLDRKLREARHEKEFGAHSSGIVWKIEKIDENQSHDSPNENSETTVFELPEDIADKLKDLNKLQEKYNRRQYELESQQQQVFADWYKYLICLYPPIGNLDRYPRPELVEYFMRNSEIASLQAQKSEAEKWQTELKKRCTDLENKLKKFNEELKKRVEKKPNAKPQEYQLKSVSAPRYWQPNEPVVMTVFNLEQEKTAETRETVTQDFLDCFVLQLEGDFMEKAQSYEVLATRLRETIQKQTELKNQFIRVWSSQPWKSFLLEWEVQVTGIREQSSYVNDFLEQYYKADEDGIDFNLKDDIDSRLTTGREAQKDVYSGRNFLNQYAADQHKQQIEAFFMRKDFFDEFCQNKEIKPNRGWLDKNLKVLREWIKKSKSPDIKDSQKQFFKQLLDIYQSFNNLQCLSQSLNGFNQALLGRKQTLQLTIDDPIGFEQNQPFVELVRDAVQDSITSAPQPLNYFNPIRSGSLKITRLRLVDTFGRVRDLEWDQTITPEYLKANTDDAVNLPPRLVQPARLNFRWLSGNSQHIKEEAGSHPNLNPICGWLLPDRLDNTLEIYNAEGHSLGELEIKQAGDQRWRPAPGSKSAVASVEDIPNPHLKRVVRNLDQLKDSFLEDFVQSISEACEQIDPATASRNPSLALMMGQPIAVVRAALNLQLQGKPAINQDWAIFKRELQKFQNAPKKSFKRETNNFTNVQFPIYLGNPQRLSDGLVGYWQEIHNKDEISLSQKVYIPLDLASDKKNPIPEDNSEDNPIIKERQPLYQTVRSKPLFLTLLIDPRGSIQAISRILPSKSIHIPSEHYVNIMNNLSITFLAAPMLSSNKISLPLAEAIDYSWSWLEQDSSRQWLEVSEIGQITPNKFIDNFKDGDLSERVLEYLCQEKVGWLEPDKDGTKYWVTPREDRVAKQLKDPYDIHQKEIEILLDSLADKVRPTTVEATFFPQEIREGWLKLKRLSQH